MKIIKKEFNGKFKLWIVKFVHNNRTEEVADVKLNRALALIIKLCIMYDQEEARKQFREALPVIRNKLNPNLIDIQQS